MNERIEAVQRMQDYIAAHLDEEITLAALAGASLYSPWYSYRLFVGTVGLSPAEYIRRLRLSKSALRLRDTSCRITDVALEAGFGSVDGFGRAFRRDFGCNPSDYAKDAKPIPLFIPYGVKYRVVERRKTMESIKTVFIQTVEKPARKVILKRGVKAADYWSYCEEVGCDVWGILQSIRSLAGEPVCLWLPNGYRRAGTSEYVQGVEVAPDYSGEIPAGFEVIDLPAATYLMFCGEPFKEEDYCLAIEEVQAAIEKYDPSVIGCVWDRANPRIQLEPVGTRGYIELLPVKHAK